MICVGVVRAAVGGDGNTILQREAGGKDGAAHADHRALHQLGGPGEADGAHGSGGEGAVGKGVDICRVVYECDVLSAWVGWLEAALHAGVAECYIQEVVLWA